MARLRVKNPLGQKVIYSLRPQVSYIFGGNVVSNFLRRHDLDLICRAHQVVQDGYSFFPWAYEIVGTLLFELVFNIREWGVKVVSVKFKFIPFLVPLHLPKVRVLPQATTCDGVFGRELLWRVQQCGCHHEHRFAAPV